MIATSMDFDSVQASADDDEDDDGVVGGGCVAGTAQRNETQSFALCC